MFDLGLPKLLERLELREGVHGWVFWKYIYIWRGVAGEMEAAVIGEQNMDIRFENNTFELKFEKHKDPSPGRCKHLQGLANGSC